MKLSSVRQAGSLVVGVALCGFIFVPLTTALSLSLHLGIVPPERPALFMLTEALAEAIACCVSGFVMGLLVSLLSAPRETRTAALASLLVILLYASVYAFMVRPLPSFDDGLTIGVVYLLLTDAACALSLVACAVLAAWLVTRRRRPPRNRDVGTLSETSPGCLVVR